MVVASSVLRVCPPCEREKAVVVVVSVTVCAVLQVWNYKQKRCLFTLLGHLDYIRTSFFHKVCLPSV